MDKIFGIVSLLMTYGDKIKPWIDMGMPIIDMLQKEGLPASTKVITILKDLAVSFFPAIKEPAKQIAAAADALFDPHGTIWVQRSLNKLSGAGLVEDGSYGAATKAAVTKFQTAHQPDTGLVDGWAGPKTNAVIVRELAKVSA